MRAYEISDLNMTDTPDGEINIAWRAMGCDFYVWLTKDRRLKPTIYRHSRDGLDLIKDIADDNARMLATVMNIARDRGWLKQPTDQAEEEGL